MTSSAWLIDPPGLFAPREEWRQFLEALQSLPAPDDAVRAAIVEAERQVAGDRWGGDADLQPLVEAFKAAKKGR